MLPRVRAVAVVHPALGLLHAMPSTVTLKTRTAMAASAAMPLRAATPAEVRERHLAHASPVPLAHFAALPIPSTYMGRLGADEVLTSHVQAREAAVAAVATLANQFEEKLLASNPGQDALRLAGTEVCTLSPAERPLIAAPTLL